MCVCVCVVVTCSPQAPIETAHAGCWFGNLDYYPGNAVAGTKEGDRPHGPLTRRDLSRPYANVPSADTKSLLRGHSMTTVRVHFPDPPCFTRRGHDAMHGCSMLPLSFLAVSRPFTRRRALVMRANGYWRCVGIVRKVCPFEPATLCQNFNHRTYFRPYKYVGLPADCLRSGS